LGNVVVIDVSVYMSVAEKISAFFISLLLRGAILRLCSLKMSGKVREKSGNLIMTGEWLPWRVHISAKWSNLNITTTITSALCPCIYLALLWRYGASKIMTSSVTWPFDLRWSTSYRWSIATMRLSGTVLDRVSTGQGKLENVREFVLSGKNIIFEKSGKMILDRAVCR